MKMMNLILRSLILLLTVLPYSVSADEVKQTESICSWTKMDLTCEDDEFRCSNLKKCIPRASYCNGVDDCLDYSDELYCHTNDCSRNPNFTRCDYSKCIPNEWYCNGYTDCSNGEDERNCGSHSSRTRLRIQSDQQTRTNTALIHVQNWLHKQSIQNSSEMWGPNVDIVAITFYFAKDGIFDWELETRKEISYLLTIQLLSRLTGKKLEDIPSTELASFVNAFLVTCINPRNFHGYDVIQELRKRTNRENYTNSYVLLALCNAGETITESDKNKLIDVFHKKHRTFWTDMQAVVVMALACASNQPGSEVDSETLRDMTLELKQQQYRNGSVINLPTTALVMQALISTGSEVDPDNFDEKKAIQELLRNQKSDGSFGDLMSTFLVAPILTCKSLVDINSNHCQHESRNEISALANLSRRGGPKIQLQYSLWIGNDKDLGRNLILRVPQNMSLYAVMEIAAELDSRFKFEYSVKDRKPFINAISGMRDNPLTEKFWFLYIVQNEKPTLSNESPADIIPRENDHYVMWYRRGTWVD